MIVGSGLIAKAFAQYESRLDHVCLYAAGVSNSGCVDVLEFERERGRLAAALKSVPRAYVIVYVSTCSAIDPASRDSPYVRHKLAMEDAVREHARHLIVRLPQVAGITPNPHTLLNYLYARISRSERFAVWSNAARNIIDATDVAKIAVDLFSVERPVGETINIANIRSSHILEIVRLMEQTVKRKAIYGLIDKGVDYSIPTDRIAAALDRCGMVFDDAYLPRVIAKYFGDRAGL